MEVLRLKKAISDLSLASLDAIGFSDTTYTDRGWQGVVLGTVTSASSATAISSTAPLYVALATAITLPGGALTDRSGTISAPNTAQQVAAANANRQYLVLQNLSTNVLWFDFGTSTPVQSTPSLQLPPNAAAWTWDAFVPTGSIWIISATGIASQTWSAKEG